MDKKIILSFISTSALVVILAGCTTYSKDHYPKPPLPGSKKIVNVYKADESYDNVPGTAVGVRDVQNVRTDGVLEHSYVGRYIDPNNSDIMYGKGDMYRVVETPHWNLTPNHDPQPYEVDEAYKNIKNLANATPLYAELEQKNTTTGELNSTLKKQITAMKTYNAKMSEQTKNIQKYQKQMSEMKKQNSELVSNNAKMEEQLKKINSKTYLNEKNQAKTKKIVSRNTAPTTEIMSGDIPSTDHSNLNMDI
jgi:hypothetical protein